MKDLVGSTLGKYSIVALLGHGGMASVYKAHQPSLDRYVAVKVMHPHLAEDPTFVSRFEREAAAVARLTHPGIVRIYDFDADNGQYYMVMEMIEGPTLKAEIQARYEKKQGFSHKEIVKIGVALAEATEYAHSRGIIHRDLKPGNVMLTPEGQVMLTDFGLASMLGRDQLTTSGYTSGTPEYMSPEQIHARPCDERSDVYSLGVVLYEIAAGRLPFEGDTPMAVLLGHVTQQPPPPINFKPDLAPALQSVLLQALCKEPDGRYQSAADLADALRGTLGAEHLTATPVPLLAPALKIESIPDTDVTKSAIPRPYRGLFPFDTADAPFFHGRELFAERLLAAVREQGLVAVVGPSGSGKSSVVFAGLVPRLEEEGIWLVAALRPGNRPFHALSTALLPLLEPGVSEVDRLVGVQKMAEALADGSLPLSDVVARILLKAGRARLLLVVDQFEELYTFAEPEACRRFPALLLEAVGGGRQGAPGTVVVLTLRADFMGQALADRAFADALQRADVKLGPMTRDELTRAIERPAAQLEVSFERGLVERILDDVGDEPGNLPLLEFALALLWDRRAGRRLTHAAYEAIGRVHGALARYAEKVYAGLSEEDKARAHRVCTQLVRPGENTEDTRRLTTRAELGEADWALVRRLADERLVVTGRDPAGQETVEVVHEALIRGWRRLQEWMVADRDFRSWQERLRAALRQWQARPGDEALLLRGSVLTEAEEWLIARRVQLSEAEQAFIQAGIDLRQREAAERETLRQRELEAARRLADTERQRAEEHARAAHGLRQRAWLLAGALLLAILLAVTAGVLGQAARRNASLAATREVQAVANADLAVTREAEAHANAALAVEHQLAAEAEAELRATAEARAVQQQMEAERQAAAAEQNAELAEQQRQIAVSRQLAAQARTVLDQQPDLALLLSLEANRLWDTAETRSSLIAGLQYDPHLVTLLHVQNDMIMWTAFSPDGRLLATVGANGNVRLWTVEDVPGAPPRVRPRGAPLPGHDVTQLVNTVAFSPDSRLLATGSDDGTIRIWDAASGEPRQTIDNGAVAQTVAFSPDGRLLASAGTALPGEQKADIRLWDTATWQVAATLPGNSDVVWLVAFSPDGKTLVSGGSNGLAMLWDVAAALGDAGDRGRPLSHAGAVTWAAFSSDGADLATSSCGRTSQGYCIESEVRLWDVASGEPAGEIAAGQEGLVSAVLFYGAGGDSLLIRGDDGTIREWDLAAGEMGALVLPGRSGSLGCMAFGPGQRLLAAANTDGTVSVWDLENTWPRSAPVARYDGWAVGAAFRPDGRQFASAGSDGQIFLHDGSTGEPQGEPLSHAWPGLPAVSAVALDPGGERAMVGRADGTFTAWMLNTDVYTSYKELGASHQYGEVAVALDPSGEWLATSGVDGRLVLWDAATGAIQSISARHEGAVRALAFGPSDPLSNTLLSGDSQGKVLVWTAGPALEREVEAYGSAVRSLALSADGRWLAAGSEDGQVGVWLRDGGQPRLKPGAAHAGPVLALAFGGDGQMLVSAGADGRVLRWDLAAPEVTAPAVLVESPGGAATAAVFHGATVTLGDDRGRVQVWDLSTPELDSVVSGTLGSAVTALAYDGRWLLAGGADGSLRLWEVQTGQAHDLVQAQATSVSVYGVAYSPDGQTLASAGANGTIMLWDVATGQPSRAPLIGALLPAESVAFDPTGATLAASGCSGFDDERNACRQTQVVLWDTASWQVRARLTEPGRSTENLAFSPDGTLLASAGCTRVDALGYCLQGQVLLRDAASGELRASLEAHTTSVRQVAFSPDGRLLASASYDRSVIVWDVATGQRVGQRLAGHSYYALSVAFSPDSAILYSGGVRAASGGRGFEGELILWDVATGQQLGGTFVGHSFGLKDLALSPDGRRLVSTSYDGTVIMWDVAWDSWRERACRLADRSLTTEEWTQFFGSEPYRETCPE